MVFEFPFIIRNIKELTALSPMFEKVGQRAQHFVSRKLLLITTLFDICVYTVYTHEEPCL